MVKAQGTETFGNTSVSGAGWTTDDALDWTNVAPPLIVENFTSPSDFGTDIKVSVYMEAFSGSIDAYGVIYSDNNFPSVVLAQSSEITGIGSSSYQWITFTFDYTGSPNTPYWFGIYASGDFNLYIKELQSGTVSWEYDTNTNLVFGALTGQTIDWIADQPYNQNWIMGIYVSYNAVSSSTPTLTQTGEFNYGSYGMDFYQLMQDGNNLYLYGDISNNNQYVEILKVDTASWTLVGNYTTSFVGEGDGGYPMVVLGGYLYYVQDFYNATARGQQRMIMKIDTSDIAYAGNYTGATTTNGISSFCYYDDYLYFGSTSWDGNNAHAYFNKLDPSTMSVVLTSSDYTNPISFLQPHDGLLLGFCSDQNCYELNPSDLSLNTTVAYNNYGTVFSDTNTFINGYQSAYKYSLTDFSQVGEWDESSLGLSGDDVCVVYCNNILIAGLTPDASQVALVAIDPSTMTTITTVSSPTGYGGVYSLYSSGNYLYAEFGDVSMIVQYELSNSGSSPTPAPTQGSGGGSFTVPTASPSVSGSSVPVVVPTPLKLNSLELFGIFAVVVLGISGLLAVMLHRGNRRHRR